MIANYHTHTARCRHAAGTQRQYVESALEAGLQILGFSDHTPYPFPSPYYSTFRMFPEELESYVNDTLALRREFAAQIAIPLGLEVEYYPKYYPALRSILADFPVDYLLLGQHFVGNEIGTHYCGSATADPDILKQYCAQTRDAMQTGDFLYLAHPDLLKFKGDEALYRRQMRGVIRDAVACGLPLELNLLGLRQGRNYPDLRFWEMAAEENAALILGTDAHSPQDFLHPTALPQAKEILKSLSLTPIQTLRGE